MQYKKMSKNLNITIKGVYKMKKKNRKFNKKKFFMNIKSLSEKYIMLSTCLLKHNIEQIIFRSIRDNNILNNCNNGLDNWLGSINR